MTFRHYNSSLMCYHLNSGRNVFQFYFFYATATYKVKKKNHRVRVFEKVRLFSVPYKMLWLNTNVFRDYTWLSDDEQWKSVNYFSQCFNKNVIQARDSLSLCGTQSICFLYHPIFGQKIKSNGKGEADFLQNCNYTFSAAIRRRFFKTYREIRVMRRTIKQFRYLSICAATMSNKK